MEFLASYVKDLPVDQIGEEDETEFDSDSWTDALENAKAECPRGFLLKSIIRMDVE